MADKLNIKGAVIAALHAGATAAAADPGTSMAHKDVPAIVEVVRQQVAPVLNDAQARLDYATNNESLATSYAFTGSAASVIGAVLGVVQQLWDGYNPTDDNAALLPFLVVLVGAGWALYGRLVRSKPIGS